jgi:hypothetical protein
MKRKGRATGGCSREQARHVLAHKHLEEREELSGLGGDRHGVSTAEHPVCLGEDGRLAYGSG